MKITSYRPPADRFVLYGTWLAAAAAMIQSKKTNNGERK